MLEQSTTQSLQLPALRGHMGDWIYYICLMKFKDVAQRIRSAGEIHIGTSMAELLQRSLSSRSEEIKTYLTLQPQRFFNAIVVGTYGGNPNWYEFVVRSNVPTQMDTADFEAGVVGILQLDGNEKIWAIDGQHRVAGIRSAIAEAPDLMNEEICVIFVRGVTSESRATDPAGFERTRRLFTTLNRYAKAVSKKDIIALDEDDITAIVTRSLVEQLPLFRDKVAIRETRNIPVRDTTNFTTIDMLYDAMDAYLRDSGPKAWKSFITMRPKDDQIVNAYIERSVDLWNTVIRHFSAVREMSNSRPSDGVAGKYRSKEGGDIFFRLELRRFGGHSMICTDANRWRCPDAESSCSLSPDLQG